MKGCEYYQNPNLNRAALVVGISAVSLYAIREYRMHKNGKPHILDRLELLATPEELVKLVLETCQE